VEHKNSQLNAGRYLLTNCVTGGLIGVIWGALMLISNAAGLGTLIGNSDEPAANLVIFLTESAVIFTPIGVVAAIAFLGSEADE
jgi:hypothetical protein